MTDLSLSDLGWSDHFARQLEQGDAPARIAEIHRTILVALTPNGPVKIGAPSGAAPGAGDLCRNMTTWGLKHVLFLYLDYLSSGSKLSAM